MALCEQSVEKPAFHSVKKTTMAILSPFRTLLLFAGLGLLGLAAIPGMNVSLLPPLPSRQLEVVYTVKEAGPDRVEQFATAPLEGILSQLEGLAHLHSVSGQGEGRITLEYKAGEDLALRRAALAALLRRAYPSLEGSVSYPEIQVPDAGPAMPLLAYTIARPGAATDVYRRAESAFRRRLSALPGIREAVLSGVSAAACVIRFDEARLTALGLSPEDLRQALEERFRERYPGLSKQGGGRAVFVRYRPGPGGIEETGALGIPLPGGGQVLLKELADIRLEEVPSPTRFRVNGKPGVFLTLFARTGENKIATARRVREEVQKTAKELPEGYAVQLAHDESAHLLREIRKTALRSAASVAALLAFLLLAYREGRSLVILISGLLVNIGWALLGIRILGVEVHLYSLAGMSIAFGMAIDHALVMLDYLKRGQAAQAGAALIGTMLTTLAALGTVFLLPEEERQTLEDFARVAGITLFSSTAVALAYIPAAYTVLGGAAGGAAEQPRVSRRQVKRLGGYYRILSRCARYRGLYLALWALAFGLPLFLLPSRIEGWALYNQTIGSHLYQTRWKQPVEQLFGGTFRIFMQNLYLRSGQREPGPTRLFVDIRLAQEAAPGQIDTLLQRVEALLSGARGVEQFVGRILSPREARLEARFTNSREEAQQARALRERLIAYSRYWSGAEWSVYGVGRGFASGLGTGFGHYQIKLFGYRYDELARQAKEAELLLSRHPRVRNTDPDALADPREVPAYSYRLDLDAARLQIYGVLPGDVYRALAWKDRNPPELGRVPHAGLSLPLHLAPSGAESLSSGELLQAPLALGPHRQLRVQDAGILSFQRSAPALRREDRRFVRVLSYDFSGPAVHGEKLVQETVASLNRRLPPGYEAIRPEYPSRGGKRSTRYGSLLLVLLLGNYILCAALFEKIAQPLAILAMVPLSFIGLFLTFAWGGIHFDQGGYAAMVLLGGLTLHSAIFVLSDYHRHPQRARLPNKALLKALLARSRAIALTVASTVFGLLPFLLGNPDEPFWFPLAAGTTGGLLFSLVALYAVVPVMLWSYVDEKNAPGSF